ncbi:MAG: hypothetical protein SVU88_04780, partial [Candidatus Nanohaloarchaea archaeon]|nr:hypothetical protein [Candidatus Nanohaloarchaea archaeon]
AYRAEDTSLDFHEYAFHSLAGPSVRETDQGYIGSARLEYGGDEFYGFGESFGDAAGDIVDTVYREARERASQVYGFDL